MSKSARRPQRLYAIVMWLLSIVFAGFLIGLGNLIIDDLPRADKPIDIDRFIDAEELTKIDTSRAKFSSEIVTLERGREDAQSDLDSARADYQSRKASLDNWLATRRATTENAQNPEVLTRTRAVENLKRIEREAERRVEDADTALRDARRRTNALDNERSDLYVAAQPDYIAALRAQELRVFLFRLVLTLPLLLIAGWLIAKRRESAYWPLYRGFVLFSLFAFFIELAPYLPSYGGYVRYAVGIALVIFASHFIIRAMRNYLQQKQAEESRSESERRQSIQYEVALKKIAAKTCPGCDRSIVTRDGIDTDFCVHCGIRLQEKCHSCGERNVSFHRFCLSCGTASETEPKPA